jgi:hypothetical protein
LEERLLCHVAMGCQHVQGEVMSVEDARDPTVIDGIVMAVLDNVRQLSRGKGMGHHQMYHVVLDILREAYFDRGLAPLNVSTRTSFHGVR